MCKEKCRQYNALAVNQIWRHWQSIKSDSGRSGDWTLWVEVGIKMDVSSRDKLWRVLRGIEIGGWNVKRNFLIMNNIDNCFSHLENGYLYFV